MWSNPMVIYSMVMLKEMVDQSLGPTLKRGALSLFFGSRERSRGRVAYPIHFLQQQKPILFLAN